MGEEGEEEEEERMEKPGEDATSAEIAQWLESGFWSSFADGIEEQEKKSESDSE